MPPVKNLIFASVGPKPEIVLRDALHNDIEIVENAEYCLVYDETIEQGLLWRTLVEWWAQREQRDSADLETERSLYRRLLDAVPENSPSARRLFRTYYALRDECGERLPALLPEVYLHFDPKTLRELHGVKRLPRQRMDFLMLWNGRRIVIEVDGRHHYATPEGLASPSLYAELVKADRDLKLTGYEVYRFGAMELSEGNEAAEEFFRNLLKNVGTTE